MPPPPLVKRLKRLTVRHPVLGLRLAAVLGGLLAERSWWAPTRSDVAVLFADSHPGRVARIQRRIAALELRNHAFGALLNKRGPEAALPLIRVAGAETILGLREQGVPVVVIFAHVGAVRSVSAALAKLGLPVSVAAARRPRRGGGDVRFHEVGGAASGARFLREALRDLEAGRVVALAVDLPTPDQARHQVPFLGRSVPAAAGPAILARMAGARVVPMTSRWLGASERIEVTVHPPLPVPAEADFEAALTGSAMRFFEGYVRANPGEVRKQYLERFLRAGPAARYT